MKPLESFRRMNPIRVPWVIRHVRLDARVWFTELLLRVPSSCDASPLDAFVGRFPIVRRLTKQVLR